MHRQSNIVGRQPRAASLAHLLCSAAHVKIITSRQNALVTRFRLARRERRAARTHLVLDGLRIVTDAKCAGVTIDTLLVSATALHADADVRALVDDCDADLTVLATGTDRVMDAVSPLRTASTAVALAQHNPFKIDSIISPSASGCILMPIGVQDPGNIGAIVRTAAAAGATGVIVDPSSADPFGWKALRGAMGCTFRLPVADASAVVNVLEQAHRHGWTVVATVPSGATSLYETNFERPVLVLIGNEGAGLDEPIKKAANETVSIPIADGVESLNVAVAAGVIAYEVRRQRTSA